MWKTLASAPRSAQTFWVTPDWPRPRAGLGGGEGPASDERLVWRRQSRDPRKLLKEGVEALSQLLDSCIVALALCSPTI